MKVHLFQGYFLFHFCWSGIWNFCTPMSVLLLPAFRRKHLCPSHKENTAEDDSFHQVLTAQHFFFLFSCGFPLISQPTSITLFSLVLLTTSYALHFCIGACDLTARTSDMTLWHMISKWPWRAEGRSVCYNLLATSISDRCYLVFLSLGKRK